jgi:AcrR family transcriptional regulator
MPVRPRSGRRPGTPQTREEILAAAKRSFAAQGFAETSVRQIAREAGVDPALVMRFFDNKEGLFAAALRATPPMDDLVDTVLKGDRGELGTRLARGYLERWEDPETGPWLLTIFRATASSPSASAVVAAFMADEVMLPLAAAGGADRPELRANLAGTQLMGLGANRYILRVEPLTSLEREEVVRLVGPVIQHFFTGDLPAVALP